MEVAKIYEQFHSGLLAYVKSKIRSKEDAEDILQNVFIKVSSSIHQLDDEVRLKNWIFTVLRNTIIDYYRVNASKKKLATTVDLDENIPHEKDSDPTRGLDQCMSGLIALLPDEYRELIVESEIIGVKQKDLADRYGMPYPSLRSRIQRGRARLKELFLDCCHIKTDSRGSVMEASGRNECGNACTSCSGSEE